MEERQNNLTSISSSSEQSEKERKSLNRRFGFLLVVAIILFAILVFEIVYKFAK